MSLFFNEYKRGVICSLPVCIGLIPVGLILGIVANQSHINPLGIYLMTLFNFAGGSEFAVIAIWSAIPPLFLVFLTTALINSRHILMGALLAPYFKNQSKLKLAIMSFLMCDETWAIVINDCKKNNKLSTGFYFGIAISLYLTWSTSSLLGAIFSSSLDIFDYIDFKLALPAIFIYLCIGMSNKQKTIKNLPIVFAFISALICAMFFDKKFCVPIGTFIGFLSAYIQVRVFKY